MGKPSSAVDEINTLPPHWVQKIEVTRIPAATAPGDCWLWRGARNDTGYGRVCVGPDTAYAHRAVYERLIGQIPEGLHLDHLCRQPPCCNPAHLEPVTPLVNTRRGLGNGSQTHCPQGHEYSPENTHIYKGAKGGPRRVCIACRDAYNATYRAKRRTQRAQFWEAYLGDDDNGERKQ